MNRFKFFILLITLMQGQCYASSNHKMDELVQIFMKKNQVEGMSIAVIQNDKTYIFNYGWANKLKNEPTTNSTIYTIASFTKTFTATLAAFASTEGKLNLDAPISKFFPSIKNDSLDKITTRQLLAHVASMPADFNGPKTYAALSKAMSHFKPKNTPGTVYQYSNVGIGVVGFILQNVYGKNYEQILQDKLLKPLNMKSTYLNVPIDKEMHMAVGHDTTNNIFPSKKDNNAWFAAASLKSTISDMAKYLQAQINYPSLGDQKLSTAFAKTHENKYCFANMVDCEQLAWQAHLISELRKSNGDSLFKGFDNHGMPILGVQKIINNIDFSKHKIFIDKTGSAFGMSGYMAYIPSEKIGVVLLLNKSIGDERIKLGRDILISFTHLFTQKS